MKCLVTKKNVFSIFIAFVFIAASFGCADNTQNIKKDSFSEKWKTMAENSSGYSPSAEPKKIDMDALSAKQTLSAAKTAVKMPTKKINLAMRQADLKAVLRAMAKAVDLNLLIKNDIKNEVSIDFRDVPWDEAFTGLLRTYSLSYVWEGNIIRVMAIEDLEQEFKRKAQEPLVTVLVPIDYAIDDMDDTKNSEKGKLLKENLESLLSRSKDDKPHGSIRLDRNSNSLIISAIKEDVMKIMKIIEALDKPRPQIMIKANIVETTKSTARDLGIMWGGYHSGNVAGDKSLIVTGGSNSPAGTIGSQGLGVNFPAISSDNVSTASGTLGLLFGTLGGNLLEVQLQALQSDKKVNILSSPSITTLDNQKAFTENGQRVPFISTTKDSSGNTTQTVTFEDAVLRLEITPHVIDGSNLKMTIVVKKDELDFTNAATMGGNPIIVKKQTQTALIVKDGETIVISGLTKQTKSDSGQGWPGLKDVPVLGWLFKSDSKSDDMEEVLIFITPRILPVHSPQRDNLSRKEGRGSAIENEYKQ